MHLFIIFIFSSLATTLIRGKESKCQADCRNSAFRMVGPTRPWDTEDKIGNRLSITRPYPYSIAGKSVDAVKCNLTMSVTSPSFLSNLTALIHTEGIFATKAVKSLLTNFSSYRVKVIDNAIHSSPITNKNLQRNDGFDVTLQVQIIADHNGYNSSNVNAFFYNKLKPTLERAVISEELNLVISEYVNSVNINYPKDLTRNFSLFEVENDNGTKTNIEYESYLTLQTDIPNQYSNFCELGCSLFFSSSSDPLPLVECTDKCDEMYRYNITVGYNDLAEVARLECRDGCQIGLMRCQPGYYCSQVNLQEDNLHATGNAAYEGGFMAHCPAGTYRDISYDAVEECRPCPPGRFREDIKGRELESCSKCPVGTYVSKFGSTSIQDCLRCPAGTFTSEPGSEFCICITKGACADMQLPSPADAEKRDTVPYIGRW